MEIKRCGSQPSGKGPTDWFTGTVRIDPLFEAPGPARVRGASVTFEPGARTAWHTHPLGQTLIVTFGAGLVQRWVAQLRKSDQGMWSGFRRERSIGMVQVPLLQ
jgi:quercetin dioxygenase-like cupin family protein